MKAFSVLQCACCGRELDEDYDEIYECPICGNRICEDCITGEYGECCDCIDKQKRQDIFRSNGADE